MSENLDPLRQKPDFEEYANEHAGTHSASTQIAVGIKQGCEHVWTSHVEPLMKELEDRDKFAIGFARFCQVDLRGRTFEDLMNEFKESLLNQKP